LLYRANLLIGFALLGSAVALSGCTDLKRALGMEKVVPDEFAVTTPAPLALPPDYALRPPRPGEARPQETAPVDQARQTVFRAGPQQAALPAPATDRSKGEGELLRQAGAGDAPSDIRQLVNADADEAGEYSQGFVNKLLFWRQDDNSAGSPDAVINPGEEAGRLAQAKAAGKPLDSGPPPSLAGTPTIERTPDTHWFKWLF
jgi:hypothetical protein